MKEELRKIIDEKLDNLDKEIKTNESSNDDMVEDVEVDLTKKIEE